MEYLNTDIDFRATPKSGITKELSKIYYTVWNKIIPIRLFFVKTTTAMRFFNLDEGWNALLVNRENPSRDQTML